jgi:beta-lactamase regulating signal transducer with metallopeptidase domain
MKELLSVYLQSGLFGSIIIVFILLARYFLKQAPRKYLCGLWVLAAIRLLMPFHVESQFSLQPQYDQPSFVIQTTAPVEYPNVMPEWTPIEPGLEINMDPVQENENPASAPVDHLQMLCVAWIAVGIGLMIYSAVSYGLLKFKVREAVKFEGNIMEGDRIQGSFLLGYFKPRIYIPVS